MSTNVVIGNPQPTAWSFDAWVLLKQLPVVQRQVHAGHQANIIWIKNKPWAQLQEKRVLDQAETVMGVVGRTSLDCRK